jgi:translation initiation factor IF-2
VTSIRVHELAKELNISSKEVVDKLNEMGVNVKNHLSAVNDADADKVKSTFRKPKEKKEKLRLNLERERICSKYQSLMKTK